MPQDDTTTLDHVKVSDAKFAGADVITMADVTRSVITDLRALFAHRDPATMAVVAKLERTIVDRNDGGDGEISRVVAARYLLVQSNLDPHAMPEHATDDQLAFAVRYLELLRELRQAHRG